MLSVVNGLKNSALVFVKPHASSEQVAAFVRDRLTAAGLSIVGSGIKTAEEIEERKLIDQHYGSLARLAMETRPVDFSPSEQALASFEETYGIAWADALTSIVRNDEALNNLGIDGLALETMWRSGTQLKLAPGTYVSRLDKSGDAMFTINGFYPAMRMAFVEPGATVSGLFFSLSASFLAGSKVWTRCMPVIASGK